VCARQVHGRARCLPGDVGPGRDPPAERLYDAKLDHQPVLAIVGQQARVALGSSYQQEVDPVSLFKYAAAA
jgi:pyruvate dehydrogenase (quinone)